MISRCFFILLSTCVCTTEALELVDAKVPAAISFFIADLNAAKICEAQHGADSIFYGDKFSHGHPGIIAKHFYEALLQFNAHF